MFHHVSSTSKGFVRKIGTFLSISQLPRHIVLKDALCFHQDLLLRCFFFRGFFLRGFFLRGFFFRGFFLCCFFLRGFFFWKVLQFMAFQVEWALQAVGELDVSAYKGVSSIHSGIHSLQVKVPSKSVFWKASVGESVRSAQNIHGTSNRTKQVGPYMISLFITHQLHPKCRQHTTYSL